MPGFRVDQRDIEFVLYEQLKLERCLGYGPYQGMGRETWEMVLEEGVRMAQEVLAPANRESDRSGTFLKEGRAVIPEVFYSLYEQFREGGWVAPGNNPEFGGMGLPAPLTVALAEVFTGACSSFLFFTGLSSSAAHLIEVFGDERLRSLCVERMYTGEWGGTMCLTEPGAGTTVGDLTTTATPIADSEEYLIEGNKIFISAGDHDLTENIIHLVLARVPGDCAGTKGISLFAVPKYQLDEGGRPGERNDVTVTGVEHKMGIKGSPTCALAFGEEGRCRGWLVGERTKGIVYMFQMMNEARLLTGAQGTGIANGAYQQALAYAKERVQGPALSDRRAVPESIPIINHPDVRRNLVMAKALSEGLRALLLQTAMYAEQAKNDPEESARQRAGELQNFLTPVCKAYASDQGFRVTELAVQIHGGYGYISEYEVEQYMRDVKIASLYEGTNGIQAMDLLGRKMRLNDGALFMTWMQELTAAVEGCDPEVGELGEAVLAARDCVGKTAMYFQGISSRDVELAFLGATPFLEMVGHTEVGRLLMTQASIATERLKVLKAEAGIVRGPMERRFMETNPEARFYDAKVKTATFYCHQVLPRVGALSGAILSADRSALEIVL